MNRAQTSIEFLLILSAVSLICLSMLVMYNGYVAPQGRAIGSLVQANSLHFQNESNLAIESPEVSVYLPLNSTLDYDDRMQIMFYGCSNGSASISLNSPSILFSINSFNVSFYGIYIQNLEFDPTEAGVNKVNINYQITCQDNNSTHSENFTTFAYQSGLGYQNSTLEGVILGRNESIMYWPNQSSTIFSLSQKSRCTVLNFFGNPEGMAAQCGTADGWEYNVFSDYCYTEGGSTTLTDCILPSSTGYNLTSINDDASNYIYSFKLEVYTPYGIMQSNVSSSEGVSNVTLSGKVIGSATVSGVSDEFQPSLQDFVTESSGYRAVNSTVYEAYVQALNNLYVVLGYYNNSNAQSEIEEAVNYYTDEETALVSATGQNSTSCTFSGNWYKCMSPFPFSYVINVTLNGYSSLGVQTLPYQGSVINLKED